MAPSYSDSEDDSFFEEEDDDISINDDARDEEEVQQSKPKLNKHLEQLQRRLGKSD